MQLDSYNCELCLRQNEETLRHMFLRYSFAKNYWLQIGVLVPSWLKPDRATNHIKRALMVPFTMEIIMVMCLCIWKERNGWLFNNVDPSVEHCKTTFKLEFAMVIHRVKARHVPDMKSWLASID
jgi:hypothetical protein